MGWRNITKRKDEIVLLLNENNKIIFFDTETTGVKKDSRIIQFSAIRYRITDYGLEEEDTLDLYLNPGFPLSKKIIEITGITDAMLASALSEEDAADTIFQFMETADLWAAYNKSFDLRMLASMADRVGHEYYFESDTIDVLEMARDIISKSEVENHKLQTVTEYLFPDDNTRFHSAVEDVRATKKVFKKLWDTYLEHESNENKRQIHFEYCSLWINPNRKSMQRIKMKLNVGEYGDVFYDAIGKFWDCKSNAKAKKLFAEIDLANLENQVLSRYRQADMDTLVSYLKNKKRQAS